MDAIVAAGSEGAAAALEAFGAAGVASATFVAGITTLAVGAAFEVGLGIGFGALEAGESVANYGANFFTR